MDEHEVFLVRFGIIVGLVCGLLMGSFLTILLLTLGGVL